MLPHRSWKIRWPDGSITEARSAYEFLARLGQSQKFGQYTAQEMKQELSDRALQWNGKFIHPYQPDKPFIMEMHRVHMLEVLEQGEL